MAKTTVRIAEFESRTPLFEIEIDSAATVMDLRSMVDTNLAFDTNAALLKIFNKWYVEEGIRGVTRFIEIMPDDEESSLSSMGIVDFTTVYLEGPSIENSLDSLAQGLSIANANWHRIFRRYQIRTSHEIQQLKVGFHDEMNSAKDEIARLRALVSPAVEAAYKAIEVKQRETEAAEEAQKLLAAHPSNPMTALWEALKDEDAEGKNRFDVPMAIVSVCGLERKTTRADGEITSKLGKKIIFGATPIILAALSGRDEVVKALVAAGADVNARSDDCLYSALHASSALNNMAAIEALVGKGAKVDITDINERTPLQLAAYMGHIKPMEFLIGVGANFLAADKDGRSALHLAACNGKAEAIKLLNAKGVGLEPLDVNSGTPLHLAAYFGFSEAIETLVHLGASIALLNKNKLTPLALYKSFQKRQTEPKADVEKITELLTKPLPPKPAFQPLPPMEVQTTTFEPTSTTSEGTKTTTATSS